MINKTIIKELIIFKKQKSISHHLKNGDFPCIYYVRSRAQAGTGK